jgi:eukaryotic-like serine/threonine-protein kinase
MELTVQNVYGLLLRSKLLSVEECRAMYARWQGEAKETASNVARFAAWMVQNRYLTDYQAGLLARGHADGFYLNEYKIVDRLGKGRMAGVYKAMHQLGQMVAIKVLPPSKVSDPNFLGRFQREARLALRLKHPNIVRAFQVGKAGNLHFLVMEYLEGETLEDVLARRGKLPPTEAVRLVHQALQGLQHIHQQGLVHRDLKPSNLMLTQSGATPESTLKTTLKILDIGLGRALFDDSSPDVTTDPGLTGEGVLLGTPDYMAPEQARDARNADIKADIYSLGCVLYNALAGQPPFPDTNIINQMIRHATEAPRPLKDFNPAVPDGLQQIVNWMLAKDPAKRYPTPERAAQALQVFLAAGTDPLASPESDPKMKPYLTWLEVEGKKRPPTPASLPVATPAATGSRDNLPVPPSLPVPIASPVPTATHTVADRNPPLAVPVAPAAEKGDQKARRTHSRKRKRGRDQAPSAPPGPAVAPGVAAAAVDVELVDMPAAPARPPQPRGLRFGVRDLLVFVLGAGLGALAMFVGCLIAFPRPS